MTVLELEDPRWRAFVEGHPDALPFHHANWVRVVAECYGFRSFVVASTEPGGRVRAGLPFVDVRHLGRHGWVALPFTDRCPPLLTDPSDEGSLLEVLEADRRAAGVRSVEVRGPLATATPVGPPAVAHILALDPDPQAVFARFHPSQVRRNIRRAEREGLTLREGSKPDDLLEVFYGLHLRTRRRQGVPVQPRRFFRLLWNRVVAPGLGSVLVVEAEGRPVAAALFLWWKRTVVYKFGASEERAWSLRPNHLLFWHAIRAACEQGYRWFDFGRTDADQEGLRAFKRSWGAEESPLVYHRLGTARSRGGASGGPAASVMSAVIRHGPLLLCRAAGEVLYRFVA